MHRTELIQGRTLNKCKFSFKLLSSAPGGGKTTTMLQEMIDTPEIYVIASPRIDLLDEHVARLREMANAAGRTPAIVPVHSRTPGAQGTVERRLRELLDASTAPHTIIATTHAALMGLGPEDVAGLHIRWDELPEGAITSGRIGLAMSWRTMDGLYDLVPSAEAGLYKLVPKPGIELVGFPQIRDDVGGDIAELHRLARTPGRIVEVDVAAWADAGVPKHGKVRWRSIWSFGALRSCASLVVAAAGYEGSLADHAVRHTGDTDVEVVPVGAPRTGQPQITIRYYTRHPSSTAWWATDAGKNCLVAISRHLEAKDFDGYWAANSAIEDFFYGRFRMARRCGPKLAGSNCLRDHGACALIYSAKATPDDDAIIAALGLDAIAIQTAREDEDAYQYVCRGRIRDPDYDGPYEIHLYDEGQAKRVCARLLGGGYTDVVLEADNGAGIMDVVRPPTTRGKQPESEPVETAAERKTRMREGEKERGRRRRAAAKATKIAAGNVPKRGRPKRSTKTSSA